MVQLYDSGVRQKDIAALLDRSPSAIWHCLRRAGALIMIASQEQPPHRFIAGADAIAEQKAKDLQEQANAFRDLSTSLAREDA